jgi:hypothetical protein
MSDQRLFVGLWRDGLSVKPIAKHFTSTGGIVVRHKEGHDVIGVSNALSVKDWTTIEWLDNTTPTELTPQELLSIYRIIYPYAKSVKKTSDGWNIDTGLVNVVINWSGTTEYPPQKKWRVPTDADKGKACKCWDNVGDRCAEGRFIATFDRGFLTTSSTGFFVWDNCEVIDD